MDGNEGINLGSRNLFWGLINGFIFVMIIVGVVGIGAILQVSNAIPPSRTISVSGEGKISVAPDLATASFSVISQGADAKVIQTSNTEKINKAITFVKSKGIEQKDITTSGYNLYPRYQYPKDGGTPTIDGYELTQTVTIKIRDLTKTGEIIAGLTENGVNQIGQLTFSVENPEAKKDQARQDAFNQARAKAEAMARQTGVVIARVVTFSETTGGYPIFYARTDMAIGKGGVEVAPPTIEPGQQELTVDVSVTYEIR